MLSRGNNYSNWHCGVIKVEGKLYPLEAQVLLQENAHSNDNVNIKQPFVGVWHIYYFKTWCVTEFGFSDGALRPINIMHTELNAHWHRRLHTKPSHWVGRQLIILKPRRPSHARLLRAHRQQNSCNQSGRVPRALDKSKSTSSCPVQSQRLLFQCHILCIFYVCFFGLTSMPLRRCEWRVCCRG